MAGRPAPTPAAPGCPPRQVILFTGHLVDRPGRQPARLPARRLPALAARIAATLDALGASPADLALTQGAAGSDLLFAEAAQARGIPLQLLQPLAEPAFIDASVAPHGGAWLRRYHAVRARLAPARPILSAPAVLGALPEGSDAFERGNQWLLDTALTHGLDRLRLIAVWDGEGGDGPGGTSHMVQAVRQRGGRAIVIDPRALG